MWGIDPATSGIAGGTWNWLRQLSSCVAYRADSLYFDNSSPAYDTLMPREFPYLEFFETRSLPKGVRLVYYADHTKFIYLLLLLLLLLLLFYKFKGKAKRITQAAEYT